MITDLPKTREFLSKAEELIPEFNEEIRQLVDASRNEFQIIILQLQLAKLGEKLV